MKVLIIFALALLGISGKSLADDASQTLSASPAFWAWAPTPPMGWNSWDAFATTITEDQAKAEADYMAEHLASHGWQCLVVDIEWYEGGATGFDYQNGAKLTMDEYGRLLPALNRFPSAANGAGFKPLFRHDGQMADVPGSTDKYLAIFNLQDKGSSTEGGAVVPVKLNDLGFNGPCQIRNLWQNKNLDPARDTLAPVLPWHGAGLYRVSNQP